MKHYTQLTQYQRYQIRILIRSGLNQTEIADMLRVHKSTISREINRNSNKRYYCPDHAQRLARARQKSKRRYRIAEDVWVYVEAFLRIEWSPEQISGWLKERQNVKVSHEHIYQYILKDKRTGCDLHNHLRCQKKYRKRYGTNSRRGTLPNRISIDERPAIVETRSRYGDWEVDTIIGKGRQQAIVTLTERKSRLVLIQKVERRTGINVSQAIIKLLKPIKECVHTITSDNGTEFSRHEHVARQLKTDFYFAHPYCSWERGLNENTNGLIRQYFPKKHNFNTITEEQIQLVVHRLNNRPRKILGYETPNQVFYGNNPSVALVR